MIRISQK